MSNNSIIDLTGKDSIVCKLIEAIEHACGWVVNHDTPDRIAVRTYIEDIQNSAYPPLEKAALISNAKRTIKEYKNQLSIVEKAAELISEDSNPNQMEEDWLAQFMDKARLVSDEEIQLIWSKLLASEVNEHKSVPKSLLFILERMSKEDALSFVDICRVSVRIDRKHFPIIIEDRYRNDDYRPYNITFDTLKQLEALGLITSAMDTIAEYFTSEEDLFGDKQAIAHYFDHEYMFPAGLREISIGKVLFTKDGDALCKAIECSEIDSFWNDFLYPWFEENSNKDIKTT